VCELNNGRGNGIWNITHTQPKVKRTYLARVARRVVATVSMNSSVVW
jgi:hypothetical protein